jgi:hypothetical protein
LGLVDGLLAVGDAGKGTMELFSPAGGPSTSFPLGIVALSMSGREPGGLLVMDHRGGHWLYDARGNRRPVSLPAIEEDDRGAQACGRTWSTGREILRLDCTRPAFQVISRDGALLRTVRTRREPVAATEAELARHRRTLAADAARTGSSPGEARQLIDLLLKDQSPKRSMRGVRYDPAARMYAVWEQQPAELGNGPARLHLFGAEGVFLATLPFPDPWVDFAIEGLTVYALAEDRDTGLVRLAAYRVALAPGVAKLAAAPTEPVASRALSSRGASR